MQTKKQTLEEVTALILCGGKGKRLRPLTESTPKPLVPIKGKPILSYLLSHIQRSGIKKIVIAAGYKAEKIRDFFDKNHLDLDVTIIESGDVDIVRRIQDCASAIKGDFILFYGDTLANVDLSQLQTFHLSHDFPASITVWPLKSQFGLVEIDSENTVTSFMEKPVLNKWINIGNFYFEHKLLKTTYAFRSYVDFLEHLVSQRMLKSFKHLGVHITVNTLQELEEAETNINEFVSNGSEHNQ